MANSAHLDSVAVMITADSIYRDSIVQVTFTGTKEFLVRPPTPPLMIRFGKRWNEEVSADDLALSEGVLKSVEKDGVHKVEFDLQGVFTETPVEGVPAGEDGDRYGMSFYPFLSSQLCFTLPTNAPVSAVVLDLPDRFRLLWFASAITDGAGRAARLSHSYAARSRFVFSWDEPATAPVDVRVAVRMGGTTMLKLVTVPLYYWLVVLIGAGGAAWAADLKILWGTILGSWIFIGKHLSSSELPRWRTLLSSGHVFGFVSLLVWGLILTAAMESKGLFRLAAILGATLYGATLVGAFGAAFHAVRRFERQGILPAWLARYWAGRSRRREHIHRRSILGREDGEAGSGSKSR